MNPPTPSACNRLERQRRRLAIGLPFLFLGVFVLLPFLLVFKISLAEARYANPPYTELLSWHDGVAQLHLQFGHYAFLLSDSLYLATCLNSLRMAGVTTLLCLLGGFPLAYVIARASPRMRQALTLMVTLPFWTSALIRAYALMGLMRSDGPTGRLLEWLHLDPARAKLLHTNAGALLGMVYFYYPMMVIPLASYLARMDLRLLEAAYDLGATPVRAFVSITLPLARRGITSACLLVFIPAVGEYVIPELLGGSDTLMIGRVMWDEFFNNMDWPMACAVTCAMVAALLIPMTLLRAVQQRSQGDTGA